MEHNGSWTGGGLTGAGLTEAKGGWRGGAAANRAVSGLDALLGQILTK